MWHNRNDANAHCTDNVYSFIANWAHTAPGGEMNLYSVEIWPIATSFTSRTQFVRLVVTTNENVAAHVVEEAFREYHEEYKKVLYSSVKFIKEV